MKTELFENEIYTKPQISISREETFPLHFHRHLELIYVMDGEICVQVDGVCDTMKKGDVMFIPQYIFHSYTIIDGVDAILFKAIMEEESIGKLAGFFMKYLTSSLIIKSDSFSMLFPNAQNRLCHIHSLANLEDPIMHYPKIYGELILFLKCFIDSFDIVKREDIDSIFLEAVQLCNKNFKDPDFGIEKLSKRLFVSRTRLHQLFSKHLNLGIKEYISMLRIICAEKCLVENEMRISEIAVHCGYNTVRSFNRVFYQRHGITPSAFRKLCWEDSGVYKGRKILSNFDLFYKSENK